jgi:hypothetical protein
MSYVAPVMAGWHEVSGEGGDIGRSDHAPDGERRAQLVASGVESVADQRGGQRGVDEAGGDEVDPNRSELEREGRRERRQRGDGRRGDPRSRLERQPPVPPMSSSAPARLILPAAWRATSRPSTTCPPSAWRTSSASIPSRGP